MLQISVNFSVKILTLVLRVHSLITTLVSDSMMPDIPPTPEQLRKFNIEKALINARVEVQELMEENQKLKSLIKDTKCQVVLRDDAIKKTGN